MAYDNICDVTLFNFTNFTSSLPFRTTQLDFFEIYIRSKVVQSHQKDNLEKHFLIPCFVFDLWRHLLTSFCSISLILPLNRLFEQLNAIFTKYLWGVKLFNMTRGTFWEDIVLITCLIFIYDVICDVILLNFTNFTTSSPFWASRLDFYEIFIKSKVLYQSLFLTQCYL